MKLSQLYNLVVKYGIDQDPRPKALIQKDPYADTRILNAQEIAEVRRIMVGIDIEVAEILLADRLSNASPIDLVVAHHPEGRAWAGFYEVMHLQKSVLEKLGIAKDIARDFLDKRIKEVERKVAPQNHTRSVDAAKLLGLNFMCIHTPADNHVAKYLQRFFEQKRPKRLSDIVRLLKTFPEYKEAVKNNAGPKIILGKPKNPAGKIFVDMTGGTEGSKELFGRLSQAGVGTIVAMHLSEEHFAKIKDEHINVVIAGHIASDTLGLNLLLDRLEKTQGKHFEIVECSGFRRFRRN